MLSTTVQFAIADIISRVELLVTKLPPVSTLGGTSVLDATQFRMQTTNTISHAASNAGPNIGVKQRDFNKMEEGWFENGVVFGFELEGRVC